MWVKPGRFGHLSDRFHRKHRIRIECPAQLVQNRKGVVLVNKSQPRWLPISWLESRKLCRCAFDRDLATNQRGFETPRKTRADSVDLVVALQLELRIDLRRKQSLTQPLKGVIARGIIRIGLVFIPSPGIISMIIFDRFSRHRDVSRSRQRVAIVR